jgi:hypothetical protein
MPLPRSIQQIREANGGLQNLTDFEIAQHEFGKYQKYYPEFDTFAKDIGFDVGGKWGNRLSASVDDYQAGLYGLGEEITGSETLGNARRRNENQAANARQLAASQGAISSYKDVGGVGDALDYVGGLAVDSLPYIGEAAVGGLVGRAIKTGVGLSRGVKSAAGAAVASYPSSVGSVLQAQREQSGGDADLGSAAALGVPFAAANVLGLEGLAARAALPRAGLRALDNIDGVKGAAARTAVSGARTGASESFSEVSQEGLTQVGRMEVDPNEEFMSPEAVDRFKESAVGGFALGQAAGSGLGGWRRSENYLPPQKTIDDGPADLLNDQEPAEPLQLGFSGYNTGVGELVTMRDGTTMLRSEFEAAVKDGRYPDGSYRFEPIDLTKAPAADPYQYEGAIDYAPAEFTPETRVPAQLEMPVGAPGAQVDLFDPLAERVADGAAPAAAQELTAPQDSTTGDLFQANPSAMAPTMFNPASEPATSAPNSPGAVARSIFSRLTQQGVEKSAFTTRLSYELSKNLGSAGQMNTYLDGITAEIEKALTKLNKLVDRESNMLTPEEYAAKREPLEQRLLTIEAARQLANEFQGAQTNAMAEEGLARASGASKIGTKPDTEGSAQIARERSFAAQLDDSLPQVDGQGNARRTAQSGEARMNILRSVMADRSRNKPVLRFRKALEAEGYANVEPTAEELSEIRRLGQRRADIRAATVVPPGLAAARGALTPRADLDTQTSPVVPAAPRGEPNPAAVSTATKSTTARAPAPAPKPAPKPAAPAAPSVAPAPAPKPPVVIEARGKKRADKAVSAGADISQLTDAVDTQTDATLYDGAVDALYRRFMETESDTESDQIMDWVKAQGKAFEKDWTGAEKRYDDTERSVKGKRGFKVGNQTESTKSKLDPDTVEMLSGKWLRWRTVGGNPAPAKVMTFEALSKIVLAVERALGGKIEVQVYDSVTDVDETQTAGSRAGMVRDGKIVLFLDGIADGPEGQKTIFHEVFHRGLRNLLPAAQYFETLNKLFMQSAQVRAAANEWLKSPDGVAARARAEAQYPNSPATARAASIAVAVDEVLADIAENTSLEPSALRKIGNWLADVAERLGMKSLAQSIRSMGVSPLRQFINDALKAGTQGAQPDPQPPTESTRWRTAKSEKDMAKRDAEGGTPPKMVTKLKSTPMGYLVRDILGGWRSSPWMLGMLTLDQIKDRFSGDSKNISGAVNAWRKMSTRATEIMRTPASIHRQWATFTRKNRVESEKLNNLFIKATLGEVWVDGKMEPRLDPRNKHLNFEDPIVVREVAAARKLWVELSPEGQAIYKAVTDNLGQQFRLKQEAMLHRVVDTYKDGLKGALSAEEMFEMVSLGRVKRNTMSDQIKPGMTMRDRLELQRFFAAADSVYIPRSEVPGPYFPLTRKGDNVVVFKSKSFMELEAELNKARDDLDDIMSSDWPDQEDAQKLLSARITAAQKDVSDARTRLETAKGTGAQYIVEFYSSAAQAADRESQLRDEKKGTGEVYRSVRKHFEGRTDSVPPSFISALTAKLNAGLPQGSAADVASIVRQMVIAGLPERASMKAELKRMGVAGVNPEDVMHSFMSVAHRNGWTISRLENAADLGQALAKAGQSLNSDEVIVANELKKRYAGSLQYSAGNALIDMASNLSYVTHLGFSIGYYMQNLMQPWMVSMPVLAGKYGFAQTNKALADATVETVKAIQGTIKQKRGAVDWEMPLDLSFFKPEERALLERLTDDGMIDITIRADLGVGSSGATNVVGHVLQKAAELSSLPAHQIEVINRVATALATFRLSRSRGNSVDAATAEADKVVVQTHVDYSVENAPRFMNPNSLGGLGRLTFQFRRYQQAMVFLWGKLLLDTIRGGDKESSGALMYLSGTNLAMAGAAGLPLAAPLGLVMAAVGQIGDEDEERDLIEMFWSGVRGAVGDGFTDLARKGIPASLGVDMSNRIGAGSILSPIYRLPQASTGQEWSGAMALQLFGATGGTVSNWADAIMMSNEDPAKAIQKTMPAGFRSAFEAIKREYAGGLTDRRGNVLIGSDELGGVDFFGKVLNLGESTKVTNMYTTRAAIKDGENARKEVRGRLMRQYTRARLDGDTDAQAEVRAEIEAFNKRTDQRSRITSQNLAASYKEERNRREEQRSGVRIRKGNQDIAEDYGVTE